MGHRLVFEDAEGHRHDFALESREVRLGRDADNDLVVTHPSVSRHHARLVSDGRRWTVRDEGSRNGVRVNGRTIERGDPGITPLNDGDTVHLGALSIEFKREETERLILSDEERENVGPGSTTLSKVGSLKDVIRASAGEATTPPTPIVQRVERVLELVTAVGQRITGVRPLEEILDSIVDLVFASSPAERTALLLWDEKAGRLVPKVVRVPDGGDGDELRVSRTIVERAYRERCTVQMDPEASPSDSIHRLGIRSAVAVPLWNQERVAGVIYADTSAVTGAFDPFSVALLGALANYAAIAVEQSRLLQRIQQEERAKERLGRYHSRAVVERILATSDSSSDFGLGPAEAEISVLFCDMVNFTAISESQSAHAVMLMLNEYFGRMTEVIFEQDGTLDKYIGDCIMAVFGAPLAQPDHAVRAARTALGFREIIRTLNARRADAGLDFRMGIASGKAVAGDLGHAQRRDWTVLGATVNLASRLESSVARAGQIVISAGTRGALGERFQTRPLQPQRPKGIARDIEAFELLDEREA